MNPHGSSSPEPQVEVQALRQEVERLNKIVQALMDRSERVTGEAISEYGLFQRQIVLGEIVRQRTQELRRALSENETITRKLRVSEARFRGLAEQSLVGIAVVEASGFLFANARFAETFGYTQSELLALPLVDTVSEASAPAFVEHLCRCQAGEQHETLLEYLGLKKDGTVVELELSSSPMTSGDEVALILVVTDVTARKQAERKVQALNRRLAELAIRDPLTGLYNRRFMEASLERELIAAARDASMLSIVICDIDHFKAVNDTYGHQAGDEVLKAFASLLKQQCRGSDIACRFGGEEFLVVFPGMSQSAAVDWAERARAVTSVARIPAGSERLHITASFGVAAFPLHGQSSQDLIAAADAALYAAKTGGRNQVRRAALPAVIPSGLTSRPGPARKTPVIADLYARRAS